MANAIKSLRPDSAKRMMSEMSNRSTFAWVGVAAAFHLVLIVATSWGFIRDHWIDPAGAPARAAQAEARASAQTTAQSNPPASQPPVAAPAPAPIPHGADAADLTSDASAKAPAAPRNDASDAKPASAESKPPASTDANAAKPGAAAKTPSHDGFNLDDSSLK